MSSCECPECGHDIEPDEFPFGDPVTCPNCGMEWETDNEESWDSLCWWIVGPYKAEEEK